MVSLNEADIARFHKGEDLFGVLVDSHAAERLIEGKEVDILSSLVIDSIFTGSKKGDHAP